jgi:hypothetical protein
MENSFSLCERAFGQAVILPVPSHFLHSCLPILPVHLFLIATIQGKLLLPRSGRYKVMRTVTQSLSLALLALSARRMLPI